MANLKLSPGVITGNALKELFAYCKEVDCALPAVNVIGSSTANAALAAAKEAKAPIIIQLSHTGSQFYGGKSLDNAQQQASIAGSIAGALHVRTLAKVYGVPAVLHTDHCAKKILPWVEGVIAAGEEYFAKNGEPLFSSHMLDLSEQSLDENLEISRRTLQRIAKMNMTLEIELGITGGEEDGVDNSGADHSKLYTQPGGRAEGVRCPEPDRQLHGRRGVRQHARRLRAGQREAEAADPARFAEVHRREAQDRPRAGQLRVPRRLRLDRGGDSRGGLLRRREDEHRHRHAVGLHAADQEVHGREERPTCSRSSATPKAPTSPTRNTSTRAAGPSSARRASPPAS